MKKKSTISGKLKIYSTIAAGILATGKTAKAAIVYTDINPDASKGMFTTYNIDFNNDGVIDAYITSGNDPYLGSKITAQGPTNTRFVRPGGDATTSAAKLDFGAAIDPSASYTQSQAGNMVFTNLSPVYYTWNGGATDKYVGVKFMIGSNVHYGWILMDVASDGRSYVVKSYAYDNTPNTGISAGATVSVPAAPVAASVTSSDAGDNGNASDIKITWSKPADETGISKYRIFVVPAAQAASFNLTAAQAVSDGRYFETSPSGSDRSFTLPSTLLTSTGNDIVTGKSYVLFVMSVATIGYTDNLSAASNAVTLSVQTKAASNVTASDVADNSNGSDIKITFDKAASETGISNYRIFVVPAAQAASFDLAAAQAVPDGRYFETSPSGSNRSFTLPSTLLTNSGNDIVNGKSYALFVMSVGSTGYADNLSAVSNTVSLTKATQVVDDIIASDESDNNNASDINVTFGKPFSEEGIASYRVFAVPSAQASSFGIAEARNVSSDSYFETFPSGSGRSFTLPANLLATDGSVIANSGSYKIFVLSLGSTGYTDNMAWGTQAVTLTTAAKAASNVMAFDEGDNNSAADIQVTFDKASDETGISSYRIFVVPGEDAASFTQIGAEAVDAGRYHEVSPDGINISVTLPSELLSTDGNTISIGKEYRVFVLSVAGTGYTSSLSDQSNYLMLQLTAPVATDVTATDESDNNNASDIHVTFAKASDETGIASYRIFVVPSGEAGDFNLKNAQYNEYYYGITPDGNNLSVTLPAGLTDANGQDILQGNEYVVFVMSVGATGYIDNLAIQSNAFMLQTSTEAVSAITVTGSLGNSNEPVIHIAFDKASDETGIASYRIFVVPATDAPDFDVMVARSLSSDRYYELAADGSNGDATLPSDLKDAAGNNIVTGKEYKLFVLSVGGEGYSDNLSGSTDAFIISGPTAVSAGSIVDNMNLYVTGENLVIRDMPEAGTVEMFTLSGSKLMIANLNKGDNYVNISGIKDVFIVNIQSGGKTQSKKFIKQ